MRRRRSPRRLRSLACAAAVLASATFEGESWASGYLTARFGGDHGMPAMPNGYAIYYNPAALGGTTGTTITGDVSLALRHVHYKRTGDALSPSDPDRLLGDPKYINANTGDANLLIDLYLTTTNAELELSTDERTEMKAALDRLAEQLISSPSEEPSQSSCVSNNGGTAGAAGAGGAP